MAAFPTPDVNPSAPIPRIGSKDSKNYTIIRSEFENNYAQVRRATTKPRYVFELVYDTLTSAEYSILESHFDSHVGTTFTFTHPVTSVAYTVTYQNSSLEKTYTNFGIVDTRIILESL